MTDLRQLAAERDLLLEQIRSAVVAAVASGRPIALVAREAGVSRPTVYAWTKDVKRTKLEVRLAELDARWEKLLEAAMQREMPAGDISRRGNRLSGLQIEARGRKVSRGAESAKALLRRGAEAKLLSLIADRADKDETFAAIRDELDEAWQIRQTLNALEEEACGF